MEWAIVYTSEYAVDVVLAKTHIEAIEKALAIVRKYRDSFEIPKSLSDEEALENWTDLSASTERIEITHVSSGF